MMERLLSLQFYFTPRPDANFQYTSIVLIIIGILLIGSIVFSWYRKKKLKDPIAKKLLRSIPSRLWWFGLALLFLLLFRETGLPYLSMRIWWLLWLVIFIYWIIRRVINYKPHYNERLRRKNQNASSGKYLPRRKKR